MKISGEPYITSTSLHRRTPQHARIKFTSGITVSKTLCLYTRVHTRIAKKNKKMTMNDSATRRERGAFYICIACLYVVVYGPSRCLWSATCCLPRPSVREKPFPTAADSREITNKIIRDRNNECRRTLREETDAFVDKTRLRRTLVRNATTKNNRVTSSCPTYCFPIIPNRF